MRFLTLVLLSRASSEIAWNHDFHDPKDRRRIVNSSGCEAHDDQVADQIAESNWALDRPLGEIVGSTPHDVSRFHFVAAESLGGNSLIQTLPRERGLVSP